MAEVVIPYRFRVKRDTAAAFVAANTLLLEGEFALELDTGRMKMGDGVTPWNALDLYVVPGRIDLTGLADGDMLAWDAATQTWIPSAGGGGGAGVWGSITGTITAQTDLMQRFATASLLDAPFL